MLGRDSINCWTVASPALELFQMSNRSLWIVDRRLLLLLARQDISKTSATAPAALSCQSVSEEPIRTLNGHPHKHVVRRTGVILNAKSDPDSRERSGGGSECSLLSGGKGDNGLGEIVNAGSSRHPRGQRTDKSSEEGGHGRNSNHFLRGLLQ